MTGRAGAGGSPGGRSDRASPEDPFENLLPRKVGSYLELQAEDIAALGQLQQRRVTMERDREIIAEGATYTRAYVLLNGWAIRHKTLPDGRRQIVNFILPGDFFCLNATLFRRSPYGISTITEVVASPFDPNQFRSLALERPLLAMAVAWCNAREEAMMAEHLTRIGRRTAYERIAHLILELWRRLEIVGLTEGQEFEMPLRQSEIGDCLGLSVVHVSRTLQKLRRDGLIAVGPRSRRLKVRDWKAMKTAAGFDGDYLYFTELSHNGHG